MSERDAFGPNLRRIRVQRGLSLEQLAESSKVSVELWKGLERNDFSKWPHGIYARSYVREYANAIGVDPETTVNDFCRWFPQGDRRGAAAAAAAAEQKPPHWTAAFTQMFVRLRRAVGRA